MNLLKGFCFYIWVIFGFIVTLYSADIKLVNDTDYQVQLANVDTVIHNPIDGVSNRQWVTFDPPISRGNTFLFFNPQEREVNIFNNIPTASITLINKDGVRYGEGSEKESATIRLDLGINQPLNMTSEKKEKFMNHTFKVKVSQPVEGSRGSPYTITVSQTQ